MTAVITQKFIFRSDLKANPNCLYLFGDNTKRVGLGGQAKEMRSEPNAVGIATKVAPGMRDADYFSDDNYDEVVEILYADIRKLIFHDQEDVKAIIIPQDGLGTGLSEMPQRAPKAYAYLDLWLLYITDFSDQIFNSEESIRAQIEQVHQNFKQGNK